MRSPSFRKPKTGVFRCEAAELELAHAYKLNISDVCRQALQEAIGKKIIENPTGNSPSHDLLEEYIQILRERKIREEEFYATVAASYQQKLVESEEDETLQKRIADAMSGMLPSASRRLPELDPCGDFGEYWDNLTDLVSSRIGTPVKRDDLILYVREMRRKARG